MAEPTPHDIQISPTIEAIQVIAENIRNHMEVAYGEDLAGHCIEASEKIVAAVFTELGIEAKTVEGWCRFDDECYGSDHPWDPHTWVEFPSLNLYVDVTADQFNYGMSPKNEFPKIIVQEGLPYGMVYSEPTWQGFGFGIDEHETYNVHYHINHRIDKSKNSLTEEMIKEVETLQKNIPDGVIHDADTILFDLIDQCDYEFSGFAQGIFDIWKNSADKKAVEQMFYEFTDMEFDKYLLKCKEEITRVSEFDVSDLIQSSSTYTTSSKSASHLRAVKIMWDVDYGADGELLPTEIDIPAGMKDVEEISDYLSNLTGFSHEGFQLIEAEKNSIDFLIQSAENRATNSQSILHVETKDPEPEI